MRINGCGCSIADFLYSGVTLSGEVFERFRSRSPGDGGIEPGGLVTVQEFERFSGVPVKEAIRLLGGGDEPTCFHIGGPAIAALILAAQLLHGENAQVAYYGATGDDDTGRRLIDIAGRFPIDTKHYRPTRGATPYTLVLSDPDYGEGQGERAFISNFGREDLYRPEDLPDSFFDADIVLFGATALAPRLHEGLTELLKRAKERGCITVVSLVFDFFNDRKRPGEKWPLGSSEESWQYVDLLNANRQEALRISGKPTLERACSYLIDRGLGAFAITNGPEPVTYYSTGKLFLPCGWTETPVSETVKRELANHAHAESDTTGCGDNFTGGMLASMATQLRERKTGELDMRESVALGISAGGNACFHLGGTKFEQRAGERQQEIKKIYEAYKKQSKY